MGNTCLQLTSPGEEFTDGYFSWKRHFQHHRYVSRLLFKHLELFKEAISLRP